MQTVMRNDRQLIRLWLFQKHMKDHWDLKGIGRKMITNQSITL